MYIEYRFADGHCEMIEVSEEVAKALKKLDKQWDLLERKRRLYEENWSDKHDKDL